MSNLGRQSIVTGSAPCQRCAKDCWYVYNGHNRCECGQYLWIEAIASDDGSQRYRYGQGPELPAGYAGWASITDGMKGKGPKQERETIINFNEAESVASIWTASEPVYRRLLKRLGRAYLTERGKHHAEFRFPVSFLVLPRAKVKRELDPSRRAQLTATLKKSRKLSGPGDKNGLS